MTSVQFEPDGDVITADSDGNEFESVFLSKCLNFYFTFSPIRLHNCLLG